MVVNKHPNKQIDTTINVPGFSFKPTLQMHTLNGPSMEATNELDPENVKITSQILKVGNELIIPFPAHSLSAIVIEAK